MNTPWVDAAWVDEVVLTPLITQNAPVLGIRLANPNTATIFWPAPSTGFVLQQNSSLGTTNWTNVTNAVNVVGGTNTVKVQPAVSRQFYRLMN